MNARERAEQAYAKIENNTEFLSDETIITQAIEDAERDAWNAAAESAANWVRYTEKLNARIAELEAKLQNAERDAWSAVIDCVAKVIENVPYADEKTVEIAKQSAQVARTFKK